MDWAPQKTLSVRISSLCPGSRTIVETEHLARPCPSCRRTLLLDIRPDGLRQFPTHSPRRRRVKGKHRN